MQVKSKCMEKYIPHKHYPKESWNILLSDKEDFRTRTIIRKKEDYYIMIKGTIF